MTYQTAAELRRANLRTLVAERGGQRELADLVGVAPAQISQWTTAARDAKTGTPRTISDESARRLEAQCGKPRGWMDHAHGHTQPTPPTQPPQISLADALPVVLGLLTDASDITRPAIASALHRLVDDPSQIDKTLPLLDLLRKGAAAETAAFAKPKDTA